MNQNLNDELALIGQLCDKIKLEAFDLQHIKVSPDRQFDVNQLKKEMMQLASKFHTQYIEIKEEYREQLPETKPFDAPKPLRTSGDVLTKMRKFDGKESADSKIDFFDHENDSIKRTT